MEFCAKLIFFGKDRCVPVFLDNNISDFKTELFPELLGPINSVIGAKSNIVSGSTFLKFLTLNRMFSMFFWIKIIKLRRIHFNVLRKLCITADPSDTHPFRTIHPCRKPSNSIAFYKLLNWFCFFVCFLFSWLTI